MKPGDKLPDLTLPATGGKDIALKSHQGKALIVYFYPKDNTPGCTQEGQDFRDQYSAFAKAGAEIVGISKDSVRSHENFKAKFSFPFALLSDADGAACEAFDVIKEKSMYGKKYMGVERSTFLFDRSGKLVRQWRGVKVKGHADEVLGAVKEL
jgi:thioredoxin-dependent peroxiredoxin